MVIFLATCSRSAPHLSPSQLRCLLPGPLGPPVQSAVRSLPGRPSTRSPRRRPPPPCRLGGLLITILPVATLRFGYLSCAQLIAQGGHVVPCGDGLGAHGPAFSINGVLALHPVIPLKHGEDLDADLVKVVTKGALADLAGLVRANHVGQVRGQGIHEGRG
eukprot:3484584-Pleurochrysis_carterae.AAC.1